MFCFLFKSDLLCVLAPLRTFSSCVLCFLRVFRVRPCFLGVVGATAVCLSRTSVVEAACCRLSHHVLSECNCMRILYNLVCPFLQCSCACVWTEWHSLVPHRFFFFFSASSFFPSGIRQTLTFHAKKIQMIHPSQSAGTWLETGRFCFE